MLDLALVFHHLLPLFFAGVELAEDCLHLGLQRSGFLEPDHLEHSLHWFFVGNNAVFVGLDHLYELKPLLRHWLMQIMQMVELVEGVLHSFAARQLHKRDNVVYEFVDSVLVDVDCSRLLQLEAAVKVLHGVVVASEDRVEPDLVLQKQAALKHSIPCYLCQFSKALFYLAAIDPAVGEEEEGFALFG